MAPVSTDALLNMDNLILMESLIDKNLTDNQLGTPAKQRSTTGYPLEK